MSVDQCHRRTTGTTTAGDDGTASSTSTVLVTSLARRTLSIAETGPGRNGDDERRPMSSTMATGTSTAVDDGTASTTSTVSVQATSYARRPLSTADTGPGRNGDDERRPMSSAMTTGSTTAVDDGTLSATETLTVRRRRSTIPAAAVDH